jgi:hypothetical protein
MPRRRGIHGGILLNEKLYSNAQMISGRSNAVDNMYGCLPEGKF